MPQMVLSAVTASRRLIRCAPGPGRGVRLRRRDVALGRWADPGRIDRPAQLSPRHRQGGPAAAVDDLVGEDELARLSPDPRTRSRIAMEPVTSHLAAMTAGWLRAAG